MRGAALVPLLVLVGCASPGPVDRSVFHDDLRGLGLDPASVVIPFEVNDDMRAWVRQQVPEAGSMEERLDKLLAALISEDGLGVVYERGYTGTAPDAFAARKANCLGFTSLFVGLAREVGIPAFYLEVDDVESFERDGDLLVISGHVSAAFDVGGGHLKILEFADAPRVEYRRIRRLRDLTAVSLYHSNIGAELLRAGRSEEALTWLRKATAIDPDLGDGWVNLGVALRRAGDADGAEKAYRRALEEDPGAASAYQNLAALLRYRGRPGEADGLMALASRASAQSPFSYLALGDLSLANGRREEARRFYRRALRLGHDDPEPYAALGLTALAGGDLREAKKWLRKAAALGADNKRVRRLAGELGGARGEGKG
ncbi:MAG TPA: tetratricopeptide repeat protein [Thermoanaerobaculia bacterium]|nr:tetratricopeptide repeat protein [Thermoanaerobaculia bacterium]